MDKKVICLVGSTKPCWKERYREVETKLTEAGYVVVSVVWFKDELPNFESHRSLLENIHFWKIDLSDLVVLIHKDAKGKHTKLELNYARKTGKPVYCFKDEWKLVEI